MKRVPRARIWRKTLAVVAAASIATLGLVFYQWFSVGGFSFREIPALAYYTLLFLSPYLGILGLAAWTSRNRPPALVVFVGSVFIAVWGLFWFLDVLFIRPDTVASLLIALLVAGPQWVVLVVTGITALLVHQVSRRSTKS